MHEDGWVQVDVIGEGARFKSEGHALKYHFLVKVWCAKGSLTESSNECPEHLILFLSDAEERYCCSLMWATVGEVSGKHVGEGVEAVNGVWRDGGKPFEGKGGRKCLEKNGIMGIVEGDVGDVDFEVFIKVGLTSVMLQRERFPLGGEGGVSDEVGERVTAPGLVRWERVRKDGMVDEGGKSGGEVVRRDMGGREVVRVVGWDMSGV